MNGHRVDLIREKLCEFTCALHMVPKAHTFVRGAGDEQWLADAHVKACNVKGGPHIMYRLCTCDGTDRFWPVWDTIPCYANQSVLQPEKLEPRQRSDTEREK